MADPMTHTKSRKHYTVTAEREPGWWVFTVKIDGTEHATQARRLDQGEVMVRDLIAIIADTDPDSFDFSIKPLLPEDIAAELTHAQELRTQAERLAEEASGQTREVARHLADLGLPLRDVGAVLGVSFQRASQLVGPVPGRTGRQARQEAFKRWAKNRANEQAASNVKSQSRSRRKVDV